MPLVQRRTWLQSMVAIVVARPWARVLAFRQTAGLSPADAATLGAIAEVVLPRAIGDAGQKAAVAKFVSWVRNYREGADRGHGYGRSTLSAPTGSSPAARYPAQFAALAKAAADRGAASFAALPIDARRAIVEASLDGPPPVARFLARPTGANLVADFMGLYFSSAEALDHCYERAIGRDDCRGLAGSERAPQATRGSDPFSTDSGVLVPELDASGPSSGTDRPESVEKGSDPLIPRAGRH